MEIIQPTQIVPALGTEMNQMYNQVPFASPHPNSYPQYINNNNQQIPMFVPTYNPQAQGQPPMQQQQQFIIYGQPYYNPQVQQQQQFVG